VKHLASAVLATACLLAGWPLAGAADPSALPRLAAARFSGPIAVDGRLDEACWREAPVASGFHVLAARKHAPAPAEETRCQVVFDEQALVVGIVCREPRMGDLIAKAGERDGAIWLDDSIEIFLRPGPDRYYHFGVNSHGTLYDARVEVMADGTAGDLAKARLWDGVWEAAVSHETDAWTLEARIPFASLDLTPQSPSSWRFNVGRTAARRLEYSAWAPVVRGFHDLACLGYLDGLDVPFERFVVDGAGLAFPPLLVGTNRLQFALPVRGEGRFSVGSVLREWEPGVPAVTVPAGQAIAAENGLLPVRLLLPVARAGILHEVTIAVVEEASGVPVLLRAHLFKAPTPFEAGLDWAVTYPSDGVAVVTITLAVAPDSARGTLRARLAGDSADEPRQAETTITQPGITRLPLPLTGLPDGFYRVDVSAELTGLGQYAQALRFTLTAGPFD
jgi:hypothetical protein